MISVCYTVKNRSFVRHNKKTIPLFYNSIKSVVEAFLENPDIKYEIVISDWKSKDTDYKWLPSCDIKLITIDPENNLFSRGHGRNVAAENAKYDNILFLDADMLIDKFFIKRCNHFLNKTPPIIYFPICCKLNRSGNKINVYAKSGFGNSCMPKKAWEMAGKFDNIHGWGKEDTWFFKKIEKNTGYRIIRQLTPHLSHQWHPSFHGSLDNKENITMQYGEKIEII